MEDNKYMRRETLKDRKDEWKFFHQETKEME